MAVFSGPSIPTANLVFEIDAANLRAASNTTNLLFNRIWVTGNSTSNGSTDSFYAINGTTAENERIYDTAPNGKTEVVWQSPSNDLTSDADGGWNSGRFLVDKTKTYRYSVWIRKKDVVGDGRAYLGVYGYDANNNNVGVYNRSDNTLSTNFYFMSRRFDNTDLSPKPAVGDWVLFVGHVLPAGSGTGTTNADSGVWTTSGTKIAGATDCYWHDTTTQSMHRSYQYYSTTTNEKQQWWQPRVDLCDGTQPSLASLLAGFTDGDYDLRNKTKVRVKSSIKSGNSFTFTAAVGDTIGNFNEMIAVESSNTAFITEQTIIMGVKPTSFAQRRNPFSLSYYGPGTITQETSGSYAYFWGSGANTTSYTAYSGFSLANNEVAVVAVTRDTSSVKWYKNGAYVGSATNTYGNSYFHSSDNKLITIGYGYTSWGFVGDIYFTLVYDRALSALEIKQSFEAVRGRLNL